MKGVIIPERFEEFNFVLINKKKDGKAPLEKGWQKKVRRINDPVLLNHIKTGGNYGVQSYGSNIKIDGENKFLIVIDFDRKDFQDKIIGRFPETFTTTSGSKKDCVHLWFASDSNKAFKVKDEKLETLADLIGEGNQIIAPGSKHNSGSTYSIVKDVPFAFMPYSEIEAILKPEDKSPKKIKKPTKKYSPKGIKGDVTDKILDCMSMDDVLMEFGVDTSKNPTNCFDHSSAGGKCLSWNDETAHCFHCDGSWNKFSLVRDAKNLTDKETFEWFAEKGGLEAELDESRKEYNRKKRKVQSFKNEIDVNDKRERIELPGSGELVSDFSDKIAKKVKERNQIFFRKDIDEVVEIGKDGFKIMKPNRFITLIEKDFSPWSKIFLKNGDEMEITKSMNQQTASVVLASPNLQDNLKDIERLFSVPLPIIYENKLTFPIRGYDPRFKSWLDYNSPLINKNVSLEEAKKILYDIFKEFCFQDKQDYVNAIAGLLTPFLRGLYSDFNIRTPLFCYMANRERAGKDYCAGVTGLVLEGEVLEETPISTGEYNSSGGNDELRKKLTSALMMGKKRFHSANNKGNLKNAVYEGFLTSRVWCDRLLGGNKSVNLNNEMDNSLSGNMGMTFTPDLANRSRLINLFLDIEDANKRSFETPDLHGWVLENRDLIFSSIYALIRNWFENKRPSGSVKFSSFPEWASICGGIMECADLGNPCVQDKISQSISLDEETDEMKNLFEICFKLHMDEWLTKQEIRKIAIVEGDLFNNLDFEKNSDKIKFGLKIDKFSGRILSDIRLVVKDNKIRASRRLYKFSKEAGNKNHESIFGIDGIDGRDFLSTRIPSKNSKSAIGKTIPTLPSIPRLNQCDSCSKPTKNTIQGIPICEKCSGQVGDLFRENSK